PTQVLHASSSADIASFAVNLSDVAPDGTSAQASRGILNATHRSSDAEPSPLNPGEVYELKIGLDALSYVFTTGHKIRVSVSSANFPETWPTPKRAVNSIFRSAKYPSRIVLPVIPAQGALPQKPKF